MCTPLSSDIDAVLCVTLFFFGTAFSLLAIISLFVTDVASLFVVGEGMGGGGNVVMEGGAELVVLDGGVVVGGGNSVAVDLFVLVVELCNFLN